MLVAPWNQNTSSAISLITKILLHMFPVTRCVYYLGTQIQLVDKIFNENGIPVVRPNNTCIPNGYLLVEDDDFERYRRYEFHTEPNLRMLILNQFINETHNLNNSCSKYNSFDIVNGLHVYLLNVQMHDDNIVSANLYSIRNCSRVADNRVLESLNATLPRWRPRPDQPIHISGVNYMPFLECTENELLDGLELKIVKTVLPENNIVVHCNNDFDWEAMEEDVLGHRADIGMGGSWDVRGVNIGVTISAALYETCATFLVPSPNTLPASTFVFQPFSMSMWLAILFLIGMMTFFFNRLIKLSWLDALLEVWRTLYTVSTFQVTHSSARIVYMSWVLSCVLITTMTSAGYTMILTRPRFETPIRTFNDIYNRKLECYEPGKVAVEVLNTSSNPSVRRLAAQLTPSHDRTPNDRLCHLCDVLPGMHVIPTGELSDYGKEHLIVFPKCYGHFQFVIYFTAGSPLKHLFDDVIKQAKENGLLLAWLREVRNRNYTLMIQNRLFLSMYLRPPAEDMFSPLTVEEMQGAFYALIIGCILSALVFARELLSKTAVLVKIFR